MGETDKGKFRMNTDPADTDIYREEMEELRVEKLSHRLTLFTILIPILLVVVLTVAYLDLKKRVSSFHSFGTTGVANLSKDLDSRFSSLSLKLASLEENLSGKQATLEKTAVSIQAGLKKTDAAIKKLASVKSDKKELHTVVARANRSLKGLSERNAALGKGIKALGDTTATQLETLSQSISRAEAELASLVEITSGLAEAKVGQKELELALNSQKQIADQEMEALKTGLQAKFAPIEKKMRGLEKKIAVARASAADAAKKAAAAKASVAASRPAPAASKPKASPAGPKRAPAPPQTAGPRPSPDAGKIIEQDIE
jgi:chromosome segregation ATPase